MNTQLYDHIVNEKSLQIIRSIELFIGIVVFAGVVGFICLSVA